MAQSLLLPVAAAHTAQVSFRQARAPGHAVSTFRAAPSTPLQAPWQTMLQQGRCSSPLELSTSGLDSPPLFGLYSVGCTATGAEKQRRNQQTEFYLNYGRAVRVLREDVASFFKQAPDTSIFTDDVAFLDNVGPRIGLISASVYGKKAYLQRIWLLRTHSRLIFSRCEVEILRMWERDSRTVALRWKLRCFPHLLSDKLVNLDGVSEYRFNDCGLIYQHTVDVVDLDGGRKRERQPQLHRSLSTLAC